MNDLKETFVRRLAAFLVKDQAAKSIRLEMGRPDAKEWAHLRAATPISGWPTEQEAVETLSKWLGIEMPTPEAPDAATTTKQGDGR